MTAGNSAGGLKKKQVVKTSNAVFSNDACYLIGTRVLTIDFACNNLATNFEPKDHLDLENLHASILTENRLGNDLAMFGNFFPNLLL